MSDTLPPGVFYRGEHIEVRALLCFGRACHRGTRIGAKDLLDGDAAQVADLYEMDVATVEVVRREARENAARIRYGEIHHHGGYVNLRDGRVSPIPVPDPPAAPQTKRRRRRRNRTPRA